MVVGNNPLRFLRIERCMKMEKKTKKEMFNIIRAGMADNAEVVAFCDHELELLAKKNSAERKPTVNQLDNAKIKKIIVDGMESGKGYTVTEIIKTILVGTEWHELTCSRCTAIVTQLTVSFSLVRRPPRPTPFPSTALCRALPVL